MAWRIFRRIAVLLLLVMAGAAIWYLANRKRIPDLGAATRVDTRPVDPRDEDLARRAHLRLAQLRSSETVPGISAAVAREGRLVWVEAHGFADLETGAPVTTESQFPIGSVSKPLTASVAMRLFERGALSLDEDIRTYVPRFPKKGHTVTARQLLSHQAGIRHYGFMFAPPAFSEMTLNRQFDSVEDSLALFANDDLLFEPDTAFQYSTYGYTLLSAAIEGVTRKPFLQTMADELFGPLQMTSTAADDSRLANPRRTTDYASVPRDTAVLASPRANSSNKWAGGGFLSTPSDLVRFGIAVLRHDVVSSETAQLMFTPRKLRDGTVNPQNYGLGFRTGALRLTPGAPATTPIHHHGGTAVGAQSILLLLPETQIVVAICGNVYSGGSGDFLQAAADLARLFMTQPKESRKLRQE